MPLTPEDVRNKRFTPVRLREGYDMGEVDQFLDEVEAELERLSHENDDLRQKLAAAQRGEGQSYAMPAEAPQEEPAQQPQPAPAPAPAAQEQAPQPQEPAVAAAAAQQQAPASMTEASTAAARMLEIATQNADQLVAEAKEQANRIVAEARAKGERTENEARGLAARLESDARQKSEAMERETADRRNQLFGQLEKDKARLEREIEELRAHERQFRSRLKNYFEGQLRALNNQAPMTEAAPAGSASNNGNSNGNGAAHESVAATRSLNSSHQSVGGTSTTMAERSTDRYDRIDRSGSSTPRLNALLDEDDESSL